MEPTHHPFRKENDQNQTSMFMFQPFIFRGVSFGKKKDLFQLPSITWIRFGYQRTRHRSLNAAVQAAYKLRSLVKSHHQTSDTYKRRIATFFPQKFKKMEKITTSWAPASLKIPGVLFPRIPCSLP